MIRSWRKWWATIVGIGIVAELVALRADVPGWTFSEVVWWLFGLGAAPTSVALWGWTAWLVAFAASLMVSTRDHVRGNSLYEVIRGLGPFAQYVSAMFVAWFIFHVFTRTGPDVFFMWMLSVALLWLIFHLARGR